MPRTEAPFTPEQVQILNERQYGVGIAVLFHPDANHGVRSNNPTSPCSDVWYPVTFGARGMTDQQTLALPALTPCGRMPASLR